ncbi:MAG: type I secretion system permease/ATPase [Rhizobacter sp.]
MRWLFASPLWPFISLAAGASLLLNLAMLVPSLYTLQVFDRVFASRSIETLVMLSLLTALALGLAYCMDVARSRALAAAGRALHLALSPAALEQALQQGAAGSRRADTDRLRDVTQLRNFLGGSGVRALFDAPWLPIYLLVIGLLHPLLALTAGLGAAALVLLAAATDHLTREGTDTALRRSRSVGRQAESLMRHAEVIIGMGMVSNAIAAWHAKHEKLADEQMRLGAVSSRLSALARIARQGVQMAVLGIGAWLVVDTGASPGIMVAATILLGRALQPVEQLIAGWKQLVDARGAWRRLSETDALATPETRLQLPAPNGRLELERVVFSHDKRSPALIKGISFCVEAGESLGVVGTSGSGKSTLARLLLGVWAPSSGAVRLDGADIAQWDRCQLGAHLGYLPQDVSLLAGTVANNIARLCDAGGDGVFLAARLAHAHEMILRLPNGYDTRVGDGGIGLSGGQRQRIALARALYGSPKLVVLDEPDAHLDAEGQTALKATLHALKVCGTTVVVVGHRAGLMAQLDKIAVMNDGALQAIGPASAMLARLQARNVHTLPAVVSGNEGVAA